MAFTLPDFNISCHIYTGPWLSKVLRIASQDCNLAYGRRITAGWNFGEGLAGAFDVNGFMQLLLPAGTDIRAYPCYPVADIVECPAFSGRWYVVVFVDDAGRGFLNEHRVATLAQLSPNVDPTLYAGTQWPTPMP